VTANAQRLWIVIGLSVGLGCGQSSTNASQSGLPTQVEIRSVPLLVTYHDDGETSVTPRPDAPSRVAVSGDRVQLPIHVGHRNTRAVFEDVPFVLRRAADGLRVTPAQGIVITTEGNLAEEVRSALAGQAAVLVPPGEWETILVIGEGDTSWQLRWDAP